MAEPEKRETVGLCGGGGGGEEKAEEEERLLEGVAVLDFDLLCSTVALQTQGKWRKLGDDDEDGGGGGVLRMWEGELLDCFEDRRIAIESICCPSYRFGKNMGRAGFGSRYAQGFFHFIFAAAAIFSCIAFLVTNKICFLYIAIAFTIWIATYLGFFRAQMRKKLNIRGGDSMLDDCLYHLICPCCTLSQESRTLEMNNVQDGTWHGRGDTICIGGEGSKLFVDLHPPPPPKPFNLQRSTNAGDQLQSPQVEHSVILVPVSQ